MRKLGLVAAIILATALPAAAQGFYVGPNGAGVEFGAPTHLYYDFDSEYRRGPDWRWRDHDYDHRRHEHVIILPR